MMISNMTSSGERNWIYIVSSAYASLPSPGNRVSPSDAANMPKIVSPNTTPAITSTAPAHHYRFVGIEISTTIANNNGLIVLGLDGSGNAASSLAQLPTDIIFDRCYVHGTPTLNLKRGFMLNANRSAVIDSYVSNVHWVGAEAQGIIVYNASGPFKIVNNYLDGAAQAMMSGGADPNIANLVPSDIEIRRNYFFKPLSWRVGDPSYAGIHWMVKNLFELKNAKRVLVEGNVMENNWADAQAGYALQFTVRNQDGTAPWSTLEDVTFRHNIVRHSGSAVNILGVDNTFPSNSQQTKRLVLRNNLFADINSINWGGDGRVFVVIAGPADTIIEHNTGFQDLRALLFGGLVEGSPTGTGFVMRNNISNQSSIGVFGDGDGVGTVALNTYNPSGWVFEYNALIGADNTSTYPAHTFFPADTSAVGFVNYAGGDYHLTGTSAYHNAGSDGKDLGADIDALNAATLHAIDGQWGSEPPTYSTAVGTVAEIPRAFIDTTYRPQNGAIILVHSGDDLQAKINVAHLGDTVVVDAGATFTGNFTLPAK